MNQTIVELVKKFDEVQISPMIDGGFGVWITKDKFNAEDIRYFSSIKEFVEIHSLPEEKTVDAYFTF